MSMSRLAILGTAIVALTACGESSTVADATPSIGNAVNEGMSAAAMTDVRTKAVLVYADWCSSCKIVDPLVAPIRKAGVPGVEFVTLDYSDKDVDGFFAQADAAGIGQAIREELAGEVTTGRLFLVDVDDQRVLGMIDKNTRPGDVRTAVMDALKQS